MIEEFTQVIDTGEGEMTVFTVQPRPAAHFPLVVMLMNGPGLSEGLRLNARRLAMAGYRVLLPDLYYRSAAMGPTQNLGPDDSKHMMALIGELTNEGVARDVDACIGAAYAGRPAEPIGLLGYCLGGRLAMVVAQYLGSKVAAAVSLHPGGAGTDRPDSPHLFIDRITAKMYYGLAEEDPYMPPAQVERLSAAMAASAIEYHIEILPGTSHGFAMPSNRHFHAYGSEYAWDRSIALFREKLPAAGAVPYLEMARRFNRGSA